MRVVVLESSPHRNGASNIIAERFVEGAREAGHMVCVFDVAHMNIRPRSACDEGRSRGRCVVRDDMADIEEELAAADMIVYGAPVYFYEVSAQLKVVIDRMHCISPQLRPGIKSLLIATACRDDEEVMSYLSSIYSGLARYLKYDDMGMILARGCCVTKEARHSRYADEAYETGRKLREV